MGFTKFFKNFAGLYVSLLILRRNFQQFIEVVPKLSDVFSESHFNVFSHFVKFSENFTQIIEEVTKMFTS